MVSPIDAPALREQIYESIKALILDGTLSPGERVSPGNFARDFGVSTMPVREALRLLEEDGFIETAARRWTRVAMPDPALADEVYPMIGVLEELGVATGRRATERTLAKLRAANDALRVAADGPDVIACMDADTAFHEAVLEVCENETLRQTVASLKARIRLLEGAYFRFEETPTSLAEHANAIDLLAAGDNAQAGACLRRNWVRSLDVHHRTDSGDSAQAGEGTA